MNLRQFVFADWMILLLAFPYAAALHAPQEGESPASCRQVMTHGNRNDYNPDPASFRTLKGQLFIEPGRNTPPEICLGLFSEDGEKLIRVTETGEDGFYDFGAVSLGTYHLVVRTKPPSSLMATVPIRVVRWPRGGFFKARPLNLTIFFGSDWHGPGWEIGVPPENPSR